MDIEKILNWICSFFSENESKKETKPKKKRGRPKKYFTDIIEEYHPELMYLVNKKTNNIEIYNI